MSTSLVASLSLRLELEKQGAVPLFRQLYSGLRAAILTGRLEGHTPASDATAGVRAGDLAQNGGQRL